MANPKIALKKESFDQLMEMVSILGLLLLIALTAYYFSDLPEKVPVHFNGKGMPDGYAGKWTIWTLPLIAAFMYFLFRYINQSPHTFNYPVKITEENAAIQYRIATRMGWTLSAIINCLLLYIGWGSIQSALGKTEGLSNWIFWGLMLLLFICIGYFLNQAFKNK